MPVVSEYFEAARRMPVAAWSVVGNIVLQPLLLYQLVAKEHPAVVDMVLGGSSIMLGALGVTALAGVHQRVQENREIPN